MSNVYITQVPHRKDKVTGLIVPTVNIAPAEEHGDLIVMSPPQVSFHDTQGLVRAFKERLADYNYDDGDSIAALGDPATIAVAFAILGKTKGKFVVLKWDRNTGRYTRTHVTV